MMPQPQGIPSTYEGKPLRWTWAYRDSTGTVIGHVARFDDVDGKTVVPFFGRNGSGWKAGAPPEPRPLFGLDSLQGNDRAFAVEGEPCAAALQSLGLPAVSSLGGSKSPHKTDWKPVEGIRRIYILPDNDSSGEDYARAVVGILARLDGSRQVKICRLPLLNKGDDIVDWLESRVSGWDRFSPVPHEPGDDLQAELLDALEAVAEDPPSEWLTPPAPIVVPVEWEPPTPLDAGVIPPWPRDVFPPTMQTFADALASSLEVPPEAASMLTLASVAAVSQRTHEIQIKPDYFQPLGIWVGVVLPPASRKTGAQGAAMRPLMRWQMERREALESVIARATSEAKTLTGRIEHIRSKCAKAKPEEVRGLMQEIEALEHDLPDVPTLPRIIADDVTVEYLAALMQENGESAAVMSDESGVLGIIAGRYSKNGGANLDLWLKGHEGSPVVIDRVSRPSIYLARPALTVSLCLQPDALAATRDTREFRGRGLLGRFLWVVPPCNVGKRSLNTPPMPLDVAAAYADMVRTILEHERQPNGERQILHLSDAARTAWHGFALCLESRMADGGELEFIRDWGGKLAAAICRIAGVLHVARHADREPASIPVDVQDMSAAIRIGEVLIRHALVAFDAMAADPALEGSRAILAWITRKGLKEFTHQAAHNALQSRFHHSKEMNAPLEVLVDRGYIRPCPRPTSPTVGRPSLRYQANPALFQGGVS